MQANPDVVVLMDVTFPGSSQGGIEMMKEIQQGVIFLSLCFSDCTR